VRGGIGWSLFLNFRPRLEWKPYRVVNSDKSHRINFHANMVANSVSSQRNNKYIIDLCVRLFD
jgi:hypothetical protein